MNVIDENDRWYSALIAKDSRFDGRFFVGISSTGIYCRPVCRARTPKKENCTFYGSAAEAENAGFRPCLKCRPELAPGRSITDATSNLARRAARLLEENCRSGQSLEALSGKLGCSTRQLRRVFSSEYHISPHQYVQTCRLLIAKNMLTDTDLPVVDVATAAGFGSLRRFNDLFKKHYRMPPTALRKQVDSQNHKREGITIQLGYRPPYRWEETLEFLKLRAIPGVESVIDGRYFRSIRHATTETGDVSGWIKVAHNEKKNTLAATVSEDLIPVIPQILARIKHLFDLSCEPHIVYEALASMNEIRPGLCQLGTRVPGCYDPFEMAVRAVLGQQITVKAASTLAGRIVNELGTPLDTSLEGISRVFPRPLELLELGDRLVDTLASLGIISARAQAIAALAQALVDNELSLDFSVDPQEEIEKLIKIKGIGRWTAQYIAMRTMDWPDTFLETDIGVKHALAPMDPHEVHALAENWRPWRSYATLNLWNSLDPK